MTEPVSFVDLAPTLLSLAGLDTPAQMQGRPLLGAKRVEPAADEMEFLYADRFDELYGMRRGLTDGKWKYIRNFNPDFPTAPYSFYQFGQPGWTAWQKAFEDKHAGIRTAAAQALHALGKKEIAAEALVADVASEMDSYSLLNLLNTLRRFDLLDRLPKDWAKGKNMTEGGQDYIERFTKKTKAK